MYMNLIKLKCIIVLLLINISVAHAQLRVEKANGDLFEDGEVFTFNETGGVVGEEGKLRFFLFNESEDESITAKIEIKEIRGADGSNFIFCVQPLCIFAVEEGMSYPPNGAIISPESYNSMDDYFVNADEGDDPTDTIEYDLRFYLEDSEGNQFDDLTITYVYDQTFSSIDFDLDKLGLKIHNTQVKSMLNLDSNDNFGFQIFDMNGKKHNSGKIHKGYNQIGLDQLSKGIYIVNFSNQRGNSSIKIVKD